MILVTGIGPSAGVGQSAASQRSPLPEIGHPLIIHPFSSTVPGTPPYFPFEIRKAYNFLPLYARGVNGTGERIAIIDAFGDPTLSSDLAGFDSLTSLPPPVGLNFYYPDGVPKLKNSGWALETSLDVEWAHAIAPEATIDLVVAVDANLGHVYDAIAFVANSLPGETVLSMSFGLSESLYPTTGSFTIAATHQLFVTIASHGTTPVASSGDSGASSCCNVQYPSSDPLVLSVGGTSLTLNPDASYSSETTWSGSTAGASIIFSKPSYQQGLGDSMRDTVDVSYDADPATGVIVASGGRLFQVGGTSAGAPQWAALVALASEAKSSTFGAIGSATYKASSYHDILTGSNGFFTAGPGWDYPTGLGSPDANATVKALSSSTVPISFNAVNSFQGFTVTTTGSLLASLTNLNFSGTAGVTARDSTGTVVFTKTYTIPSIRFLSRSSGLVGSFILNIAVSPYLLSSDITVAVMGGTPSVSVQVTRQVDVNGDGVVNIIDVSIVATSFGSILGSPSYNPKADINADGVVNIIDVSIVGAYFGSLDFI